MSSLSQSARIARYMALRIAQVIPTILLIIVINFFILKLTPGDVADVLAGEAGYATPELMAQLRHQFGLDQPLHIQFGNYMARLLSFDLGYSWRNNATVLDLIASRLPNTLVLMISSLALATLLGIVLGTVAACWHGKWLDDLLSGLATIGFATPVFWIGLMLIVLFAVELRWLPSGGTHDIYQELTGWSAILDRLRHLILPVITLSVYYTALYIPMTRAAILEVRSLDYVRTAHAKGLGGAAVLFRHVLRNALPIITTLIGFQLGALLGGSVVVETVFAWPGIGRLAYDAVFQRDINLLLGVLFFSALLVIFCNLVTDLLCAILDPRIDAFQ